MDFWPLISEHLFPLHLPLKEDLLCSTQMNSVFAALWLATHTRDNMRYSRSSDAVLASDELSPIYQRKKWTTILLPGHILCSTTVHQNCGFLLLSRAAQYFKTPKWRVQTDLTFKLKETVTVNFIDFAKDYWTLSKRINLSRYQVFRLMRFISGIAFQSSLVACKVSDICRFRLLSGLYLYCRLNGRYAVFYGH